MRNVVVEIMGDDVIERVVQLVAYAELSLLASDAEVQDSSRTAVEQVEST